MSSASPSPSSQATSDSDVDPAPYYNNTGNFEAFVPEYSDQHPNPADRLGSHQSISDSDADSASYYDDIGNYEAFVPEHSNHDSNSSDRLRSPQSISDSDADSVLYYNDIENNIDDYEGYVPQHSDNGSQPADRLGSPHSISDSDADSALYYDDIGNYAAFLPESLDHDSNSSDRLGPRALSSDSEIDDLLDWDPEEVSDLDDNTSTRSESISSQESSVGQLFENPDLFSLGSYPLSPDLEGELELALLAEMDEQLRHRPYQEVARHGDLSTPRQGGGASSNGPDVLVDLDFYNEREGTQRRAQNQQGPADVIDLTNEPDSPVQNHAPRPRFNPRRQNSQVRNPPSLARSDSSILAGNPTVIDLTDDSPEVARTLRPERPAPRLPPMQLPRDRERREAGGFMFNRTSSAFSGLAAGLRRHLYPLRLFPGPDEDGQLLGILQNRSQSGTLNTPLGNIQLQYEHGAFDRAESPKPVHQPPPPAKAGYTRDTGPNLVVICPACNEELAYDPDVSTKEGQLSRKGKRARSEHHFWALKACGHVYCEDCFENRKPTAKRPNTGLPRNPEGKVVCAVDGCNSQALHKIAWVGIFL